MLKKYYKILFFIGLACIFICLPTNKVFAELEVSYPTIKTLSGENTEPVIDLPSYVKYLFNAGVAIGLLIVLLSLVIAGAIYFFAPLSTEMRKEARDRIAGAISGLLILLLTYLIISTINPQLSVFNINKLESTEIPTKPFVESPGVYFCDKIPCGEPDNKPNTSNVLDFGDLRKSVKYINTKYDTVNGHNYMTILYENPNLWGKCQYFNGQEKSSTVNPNGGMITVEPFASSASVYEYNYNATGDGVYFFRKPCFNDGKHNDIESLVNFCKDEKHGGFYKVPSSAITNQSAVYVAKLDDLTFENVPEEEQNCTKWDKKTNCIGRGPVNLGGENLSSIIINGEYLVVLVYFDKKNDSEEKWTACQEFPLATDVNNTGPRQVKWDIIRNSKGVIPNYVIIFPIKKPSPPIPTLTPVAIPAI